CLERAHERRVGTIALRWRLGSPYRYAMDDLPLSRKHALTGPRRKKTDAVFALSRRVARDTERYDRGRPEHSTDESPPANGRAHGMTSVACAMRLSGMASPIRRAAARLTMRPGSVGCSIGRSPGSDPLRILSTRRAAF